MLRSSRGPIEIYLGGAIDWEAVEERATRAITRTITEEGAFNTEMASASFLAHR
jgi:hypothetical protein